MNFSKETDATPVIRPKSVHGKAAQTQNPFKVSINLNSNTTNDTETKAQKLFDNFFRFKNCQEQKTSDFSENLQEIAKKNASEESNSSKETQKHPKTVKNSSEFLKSIDEYLIYLTTNEKENAKNYINQGNHAQKPYKELIKENISLKSENQSLKQKAEKYENKIRENASAKKMFLHEFHALKVKDAENSGIIKMLQGEIHKMSKFIEELKFKLKVTQESLVKQKIEAENSMIALKRVLFK